VGEALDLALRDLEQPATAVAARLDTLKNELARLEVELNRYAEAVADAGPLETLLQAVKVREQRRDTIRSELKTLTTQRRAEPRDTSDIRATLVKYLETWRAMARPRRHRGPWPPACSSRRPLRLHARHPAARLAATERSRPEAALHLRVER